MAGATAKGRYILNCLVVSRIKAYKSQCACHAINQYKKSTISTRNMSCLSGAFIQVFQESPFRVTKRTISTQPPFRVTKRTISTQPPFRVTKRTISTQPPFRVTKRTISTQPYYDFFPVTIMQSFLDHVHLYTGLPWWATIVLTTLSMRALITLPLARHQAVILARIELLQPTLKELAEALKHNVTVKGKRAGKTVEEVNKIYEKEFRNYMYQLYRRDGCSPLRLSILPWMQLPLWIVISLALRNMSGFFPKASAVPDETADTAVVSFSPYLEFHTEGLLWFSDLCVPDPTWILPIILGFTNLANIQLNSLRRQTPTGKQRAITNLFRGLSILMVGVATQVPSAMALYWATSSTYGLVQNVILKYPVVRRTLKIPHTPSESKMPIKDMIDILKLRTDEFVRHQRK